MIKNRKKITITHAIEILTARVINGKPISCNRATVSRWCKDGLLDAERDELTQRWQPYLDAVEKFIPPKRGNPAIGKLRRRTLKRAARKSAAK